MMPTQVPHLDAVIKARKVPIKHIASACNVGSDTLMRWRKGTNPIPSDKLPILARVLDTPVAEFMGWDEQNNEQEAA
jgi:transcriptional regulator with XRE-family HTH domain